MMQKLVSCLTILLWLIVAINAKPWKSVQYLGNCNSNADCPDSSACFPPRYGRRCQKKCYPCNCTLTSQCYLGSNHKDVLCNCTNSGFTGQNCETSIDDCNPNPCQNNGTCLDGINSFNCTCQPGYSGNTCEDSNPCDPNPCENGGTCSAASMTEFSCACPPSLTGDTCDTNSDPCIPNPCLNNGVCIPFNATASFCSCVPPYLFGPTCGFITPF